MNIQEQENLLEESLQTASSLSEILKSKGMNYDTLIYKDNPPIDQNCLRPIELLDDKVIEEGKIPAVSFFSGAGGLNVGFQYAGFQNIISVEVNETFCNTLRKNNPDKLVIGPPQYEGNVRKTEELAKILIENGVNTPFEGVFHGGPPCQSFSVAANQRFNKSGDNFKRKGFEDEERGMLIFDYIWFIKKFRPFAFLIENVSGIMDFDVDGKIRKALDELKSYGYTITPPQIVNATDYGVPQNRMRWIVMGTRGKTPICFPKPNAQKTPCGSVFMRNTVGVANHVTREHTAKSISRYMLLEYGGRDKLGRVDRLDPQLPSKTVIAGGTKGGGRSHLHPFIPRTISVRECARLQSFPDWYVFTGPNARQFTQVGNAVPPLLAYKLALEIRKAIETDKK